MFVISVSLPWHSQSAVDTAWRVRPDGCRVKGKRSPRVTLRPMSTGPAFPPAPQDSLMRPGDTPADIYVLPLHCPARVARGVRCQARSGQRVPPGRLGPCSLATSTLPPSLGRQPPSGTALVCTALG